jgi:hypothetical protein
MQRTYTDEEVQDLTDRVFQLTERIESGTMNFAPHLVEGIHRSLQAIRLRPDGLVDPETVDSRIRAMTMAVRAMTYREDTKKQISIAEIQEHYFQALFANFGQFYEMGEKAGASPARVAEFFAQKDDIVRQLIGMLPEYSQMLRSFWESTLQAGNFHLQDGQQLKATFGGDIFPGHWENVVSSAGLYIDTIVLPCPILRIAPLVSNYPDQKVVELLLKHVLTAMSYSEAALAELDVPIVVIFPGSADINPQDHESLMERAQPAIRKHASYLFGRDFESPEHMLDFCRDLQTPDQVLAELRGGDRLLFESEWELRPEVQLAKIIEAGTPGLPGADVRHAGAHVAALCLGRMPQALGLQLNAIERHGSPLISADTSWRYYTWLLEYQSQPANSAPVTGGEHIARALMAERSTNLEWLGNVPVSTVIELRKKGLAEDIRAILGEGIDELVRVNPKNYHRTADKVVDNLNAAFEAHTQKLREARAKKLKLFGLDLPKCLISGVVGVAGAWTGNVPLAVAGATMGFLGGFPNLKDIKTGWKEAAKEDQVYQASPTGILFRHLT